MGPLLNSRNFILNIAKSRLLIIGWLDLRYPEYLCCTLVFPHTCVSPTAVLNAMMGENRIYVCTCSRKQSDTMVVIPFSVVILALWGHFEGQ